MLIQNFCLFCSGTDFSVHGHEVGIFCLLSTTVSGVNAVEIGVELHVTVDVTTVLLHHRCPMRRYKWCSGGMKDGARFT